MTLKLKRAAAILEGGPRSGFGYYADEIEEQARIAERMGRRFDYQPTERQVRHPGTGVPGVLSQVWVYISPPQLADYTGDQSATTGGQMIQGSAPETDLEPSKLEEVRAAMATFGRQGAQLHAIAALTPYAAHQVGILAFWLCKSGVAEHSPFAAGLDPHYRLVAP